MLPTRNNNRLSSSRKQSLLYKSGNVSEAMRPCKRCVAASRRCQLGEVSKKCLECVRAGRSCNLSISAKKLSRLYRERLRLRREVRETQAKLMRL